MIEVVIDDSEVDLHLLSLDEYANKYGHDIYMKMSISPNDYALFIVLRISFERLYIR